MWQPYCAHENETRIAENSRVDTQREPGSLITLMTCSTNLEMPMCPYILSSSSMDRALWLLFFMNISVTCIWKRSYLPPGVLLCLFYIQAWGGSKANFKSLQKYLNSRVRILSQVLSCSKAQAPNQYCPAALNECTFSYSAFSPPYI